LIISRQQATTLSLDSLNLTPLTHICYTFSMKKVLIGLLLFYVFFQLVYWANNKVNEEFFDEFYTRDYDRGENAEPYAWEKAIDYIKEIFEDDNEKEHYILR